MITNGKFMLMCCIEEFKSWIWKQNFNRKIKLIQNHHTYIPDYSSFKNDNYFQLAQSMEHAHINRGFSQIGQNITTYPDGKIMICRPLDITPAGIRGANTNGIAIEHVGNFDIGKDTMTEAHKETIIKLNAILCIKFKLYPSTDYIVYHHWYDLSTAKRTDGAGTTKSCPGTAFFGGNSVESAKKNFIPLIDHEIWNTPESPG